MEDNKEVIINVVKKSKNPVYSIFFYQNELVKQWAKDGRLHKTIWRNTIGSENSFCLKKKGEYRTVIPGRLIKLFGIKNENLFKQKYVEAISGDGQEWTRITTLHSSSLLALLFFYNVTSSNKLTIGDYTFSESFFEIKTHVHDDSESNMDVVLRGTDSAGMKIVLFLECKFSEYLNCSKYDGISWEAYNKTYDSLGLFNNNVIPGLKFFGDPQNKITIQAEESRKKPIYCGGIKQMISHYMGVSNYAKDRGKALAEHRFVEDVNEKVLLGEILFDFKNNEISNSETKLDCYKYAYEKLAQIINGKNENKNFKMLENIFTYQDVLCQNKNFIKEEQTLKLYFNNYSQHGK